MPVGCAIISLSDYVNFKQRRTPYSTNRGTVSSFNTAEVKAKIFVEQAWNLKVQPARFVNVFVSACGFLSRTHLGATLVLFAAT